MPRDLSNHRYLDKYRSKKTGKWVYMYANDNKRLGDAYAVVRSHSRGGMTKAERARDDRRHRAYNKKRMAKNAGNIFKNLGRAAKAFVTGKDATKYLARTRKSALKTARNATNLATSYSGHTGKRTKTKQWIEKQLYGNKNGTYRKNWRPNGR